MVPSAHILVCLVQYGIMHAFIALGSVKQATLQMVAPGIAEAIATAIGLFMQQSPQLWLITVVYAAYK